MRLPTARSTRRWILVGLVVVLVAAAASIFWPRDTPVAIAEQQVTVPGAQAPWDKSPVQLDATLYLPPTVPAPAVIMAHGFGGSKASIAADAIELARDGFVVLAYSARGFGASTGEISLDSLDAEVPDGGKLVDYLATRPEVLQDKAGDPRVGVTGGSYGGALSLMLAGTDPRIDVAVPIITWNDLRASLFPNAVAVGGQPSTPSALTAADDGVFKKYWAAAMISSVAFGSNLSPTTQADTGPTGIGRNQEDSNAETPPPTSTGARPAGIAGCGRLRLEVCAAYAEAAATGKLNPTIRTLLKRSSPAQVVGKITAPTLLVQGELDTLFPLDQADANARAIAANGTTVAVDWYRGGHDGGSPDSDTRARINDWLSYYLATGPTGRAPSTGFRYSVDGGVTDSGRPRTRVLQSDAYPGIAGAPGVARSDIALTGGEQVVINPPGGTPAGISSLPGFGSTSGGLFSLLSAGIPGQSAIFSSAPFDQLAVVTGSSRVSLTITGVASAADPSATQAGGPVLFASIGSQTAGGLVTMGGSAVSPIRLPRLPANGSPTTVTIDLPAVSLQVSAGDSLIVRISTTDQAYSGPTASAAYQISGVTSVSVPAAGGSLVSEGEVSTPTLIALLILAVGGILALILAGRVRHRRQPTTDAIDEAGAGGPGVAPLTIENLSKHYPGGVQAVQDVSFEVKSGQVLGLLGPNGAGKTTTLRMVMGLIQPTSGQIMVFGVPVTPGAEILSRVGSFVEGSGFLPHLSGRANLELYWRSTGRPIGDSHLDEVLAIAGLGQAVRRRVKTYSQGMRQRLAIAQSMLGLPDLLLLDEPTNGLDPPQIHAMREVLRGYAATGRTVLVSSHLLSEVEQTCTDVVVINLGKTIADGTVAELIAQSGEMAFTVDDPGTAITVLKGLPDVTEIQRGDAAGTVLADLAGLPAATAVSALVMAGIAVSSAAPRNRLEDVFLDLVGATGTQGEQS